MSMAALLLAMRDHLRNSLGGIIPGGSERAAQYIEISPDGRPPAMLGDWFIGIDEGSVQSADKSFLKEAYATVAVITHKAQTPRDRRGTVYTATGSGLDAVERAVIVAIHDNQTLRLLANTLLGAPSESTGDGFIKPLWYAGRGPTQPQNGEWIGAEPAGGAFLTRRLRFEGATRIQALDIMH
jgi:hypothetical protein